MSRLRGARADCLAFALAALAISAGIVLFQPSSAMSEDLGRHLLLGRIIWEGGSVPATNLLTYTHPDFPFVNHHWLSEVLMYLTTSAFGLRGLMLLKVALLGSALAIATWSAVRMTGPFPAAGMATVFLPLMLERNSERPEMFAYPLFAALFFVLFVAESASAVRRLVVVTATMLLWVNLHISFVYGLLLIGVHAVKETHPALQSMLRAPAMVDGRYKAQAARAAVLAGAGLLVTVVNPNGLQGAIYPLTIFRNFGYETVENVGVLRLLRVLPDDPCLPYFMVCAAACTILITLAIVRGAAIEWSYLLALGFTALVFAKIRNLPYFVLLAIPACASAAASTMQGQMPPKSRRVGRALTIPIIALNIALSSLLLHRLPPALSVPEPGQTGLDLFELLSPAGNVFNNFDVGSYLEYRLYPKYKSFVDNRPEAFPAEFFSAYRRIQTDVVFRRRKFQDYGINSIVFSRSDSTDWGIRFLEDIRQDPEWRLDYIDSTLVIYSRRRVIATP